MDSQRERADHLGDLVNGHRGHVEAALPELEAILRAPRHTESLVLAIDALGSAWDARAADLLLTLVDPAHPDSAVRSALVHALPGGSIEEPQRSAAIELLARMTTDDVADVRDWACFGLLQLEADTPAALDALAARGDDPDPDTRAEAVSALAAAGDPRALDACIRLLSGDPDRVELLTLETAAVLADPALLPALRRLRAAWADDPADEHAAALVTVMQRCRTG